MKGFSVFVPETHWETVLAQASRRRQKACQELQMEEECLQFFAISTLALDWQWLSYRPQQGLGE